MMRSPFARFAASLVSFNLLVGSLAAAPDPAPVCNVVQITLASGAARLWSPSGDQYLVNAKDEKGVYQIYVGGKDDPSPVCISCDPQLNGPSVDRHKLQAHWHPSNNWIVLAVERDNYDKPLFATKDLIEGWVQSGIWVNIYAARPDGSQWYQLSDFGHNNGDGFTGVAFTPDGTQGVWAQIVGSPILNGLFGKWQLIVADFQEDANGVPAFVNRREITPDGANWLEPGNFSPDGKSLLLTADVGMKDPQGMDQFVLDITTGTLRNLTNSPNVWDEHGVFSPDGQKILFMSSYPFQADRFSNKLLFLKTEFMMMNADGSGLQQLTHFNTPGYTETNPDGHSTVAAVGGWNPDGHSLSVSNLTFPTYDIWTIAFDSACGADALAQNSTVAAQRTKKEHRRR